jgi:hypothetical protein
MEGLILRLSALDADAENALRVIGFFDQLIANRVDLQTLVTSAARLAECPAGVCMEGKGLFVRAEPHGGVQVSGRVPSSAARRELADGGMIWLERADPPVPLDAMVLERFAIAAAVLLEHSRVPLPELGDPALVELVLSEQAGVAERSRALQLLGFTPTTPLNVLADEGGKGEVFEALGGRAAGVRRASLGALSVTLVAGQLAEFAPQAGTLVGVGERRPAIEAPQAWREARTALRFAHFTQPLVRFGSLGSFALLAEKLTAADLAGVADLQVLDGLSAETLDILAAVSATDSVRKAAAAVFRHHSTVAARLAQAEVTLGFKVDTPYGRARLQLALVLRQLRDSVPVDRIEG